MKKILVVEDDKEINNLLKDYLTEQGYSIFSAFQGLEAISIIRENKDISMIILDLMLPFQSGDKVLSKLREFSDVPVIVVSAKDTVQTKIDIIRMGADDYITKPFDLDELLVRIEAVLRRSDNEINKGNSRILSYNKIKIDRSSKEVEVYGKIITLTSKEYAILELMLLNPTKLFSKANLFEHVWNEVYYNEDNTLKVHMSNLRNKLKSASNSDEYIETVWGMGYRLKKN